jgi:hypothetical protein
MRHPEFQKLLPGNACTPEQRYPYVVCLGPCQPTSSNYFAPVQRPALRKYGGLYTGSKVPCTPEVGSIPGTEEAWLGLPGEAPSLPCSHLLSNGLLHLNKNESIFHPLYNHVINSQSIIHPLYNHVINSQSIFHPLYNHVINNQSIFHSLYNNAIYNQSIFQSLTTTQLTTNQSFNL